MTPKPIRLFSRGAIMLLMMLLTTTTAWAQGYDYIDADGTMHNTATDGITVTEIKLSNMPTKLSPGWYVVTENVSYTQEVLLNGNGDFTIILGNNCTMSIGTSGSPVSGSGLYYKNNDNGCTLTIYGQSLNDNVAGHLNIYSNGDGILLNGKGNYCQHSGNVTISCTDMGLYNVKASTYLNGGTLNITSGNDVISSHDITITGGKLDAIATAGYSLYFTSGNATLGLRNATDYIHVSQYYNNVNIADGQRLTNGTNFYAGNNRKIPINTTLTQANFTDNGDGTYTIGSTRGWNLFCDALQDKDTYNRFSGKTVKLDADISVSTMAGTSQHDFCGTFDGQKHTLTVNLSSDYAHDYTAPFSYVANAKANPGDTEDSPAAICNLNVSGTVTATKNYASGIVGAFWGTLTIENCTSSVDITTNNKHAAGFIGNAQGNATIRNCLSSGSITSSVSGDGTHGGFIGGSASGKTFTIEGCAFTGSLLSSTSTPSTHSCAGFMGYNSGTLTINNSLFAPASVSVLDTESATFARGNSPTTNNTYYTQTLGTVQGKATHTVTAGDHVTISGKALTGSTTQYDVSGITAYSGGGLSRGGNLYFGSDDKVNLTLANDAPAPAGYQYDSYNVSGGTLSGSTLTMPDDDVTVSVNTNGALTVIDWQTVNEGTKADPYMIYNKDQLQLLAYRVNGTNNAVLNKSGFEGKYFKLGADIAFSYDENEGNDYKENYETIGRAYLSSNNVWYKLHFQGDFDGDGHTVSGIRIVKGYNYQCLGLFGLIGSSAKIHHVHLTDARIKGTYSVGGIVGGIKSGGTVSDCTVSGCAISSFFNNSDKYIGIISGDDAGTFQNNNYYGCTVNGTAVTSGKGVGNDGGGTDVTTNDGAVPMPALIDGEDNTDAIATLANRSGEGLPNSYPVVLQGRTLYKDGSWNTLCLPFNVTLEGSPLFGDGMDVRTLNSSSFDDGTLTLTFTDEGAVTTMEAGKPYIIRWTKPEGYDEAPEDFNITDPVFSGVTVTTKTSNVETDYVDFIGTFSPQVIYESGAEKHNLYLGTGNTLYYPSVEGFRVKSCRAWFQLKNGLTCGTPAGVRAFNLSFDGEETGISLTPNPSRGGEGSIYTLSGMKLNGKPTRKGLYIHGRRKVVVK